MNQTLRCFARAGIGCYISLFITLVLAGCAGLGAALQPGEPESAVIAKIGKPTHVFDEPDNAGRILEYMTGPFGQETYFARIDENGNLRSYEQVLKSENFAKIVVDSSTKFDVLHIIGTPSDTVYLRLSDLEVWSYPYKESPVSNSMMHVHFDKNGVVRKMLNGPDPRRELDERGVFGLGNRGFNR